MPIAPSNYYAVPQMRTVAGETVTSTSHRRIASTSPIRAEVPNITSMMASSSPSGLGPDKPLPLRHSRTAQRITSTSATVSAIAVEGGLRSRTSSRTGFFAIASYLTASPKARLRTVRACFAML